jgi:tryptophanyl-tRNA synthetase
MLTGDRPTGKLHLGHYVGSIANRVQLQHKHETFLIIADLDMLTTKNTREDIAKVSTNARDMVLDSLAAGIDPAGRLSTCNRRSPRSANSTPCSRTW